jgi:hypothetical protein
MDKGDTLDLGIVELWNGEVWNAIGEVWNAIYKRLRVASFDPDFFYSVQL